MPRAPATPFVTFALAAALLLAGCLHGPPGPAMPGPPPLPWDIEAGFEVDMDADDCQLAVAVIPVDRDRARDALPPGFEPGDAGDLVPLPTAQGQAAVLLSAYACRQSGFAERSLSVGEVNVYVAPPDVPGDRPPVDNHYYLLALYTGNDRFYDMLRAVGVTAFEAIVEATVNAQPTGSATGNGMAQDEYDVAFRIGLTAPIPERLEGASRFWHQSPEGMAYLDYDVPGTDIGVGSATCAIREDTPAHEATGITGCGSFGGAFAIAAGGASWTSRFVWEPGVHAA